MKLLTHSLTALFISLLLLSGCSKTEEAPAEPAAEMETPAGEAEAPAAEEPAQEEPGGWVPPAE